MDDDATFSDPFKYKHLGSLAYIGNAAVFDLGGSSFMGGLVGSCPVYALVLIAFAGRNVRLEEHILE